MFDFTYILLVSIGLGVGTGVYYINLTNFTLDTSQNKMKAAMVLVGCAALAVFLAFLLNYVIVILHGFTIYIMLGLAMHFLFCFCFFALLCVIALQLAKLDVTKHLNAVIPSIAIAGAISKAGCLAVECCAPETVTVIEIIFLAILFLALQALMLLRNKKFGFADSAEAIFCSSKVHCEQKFLSHKQDDNKDSHFKLLISKFNNLELFIFTYMPFRFTIEFFRYEISTWLISPEQLIAAIAFVVVLSFKLIHTGDSKSENK